MDNPYTISVSLLMMLQCVYQMLYGKFPWTKTPLDADVIVHIIGSFLPVVPLLHTRAEEHLPNTLRQALIYKVSLICFYSLF